MSQAIISTLETNEQGLLQQAIVQIAVTQTGKDEEGDPVYEIQVYPRREGDTVIYNVWDPDRASPAKPREVRWVVSGLTNKQQIRIEAKSDQDALFRAAPFTIPPLRGQSTNTHTSGPPRLNGKIGRALQWSYSIALLEDGLPVPGARLDPVIIIKDDP